MTDTILERSVIESKEEWRSKWVKEIPYLHFDADWEVKIIPPFAGALARFIVKKGDKAVSVYFDGYSQLGFMYDENDNPIKMLAMPQNQSIMISGMFAIP